MSKCEICKADCVFKGEKDLKPECRGFIPMTNADRIRAMSDEELAELLMWYCPYPNRKEECEQGCEKCVAEWLKSPVKEDA